MFNAGRYFKTVRLYSLIRRFLTAGVLMLSVAFLSACGGIDGVQFEGKIFEVVGLNEYGKKKKETQVEQRGPLVMPPKNQLPDPGKRAQIKDSIQWPDDPDERRKRDAALLEEEKKKVCPDVIRDPSHPLYDEKKARMCRTWLGDFLTDALKNAQ